MGHADVTSMGDRRLAEKLRRAPVGFAVLDGEAMTFGIANERFCELVSRRELEGRAWPEAFPELVGTATHDALRRAYAGERVELREFPVTLVRDGHHEEGFYSFVLDPIRDAEDEVTGVVLIVVDVTELVVRRKDAEQLAADLARSEARYRTLFESLDDGFCIMQMIDDEDGNTVDYRFLEVNDAFVRHTGLVDPIGKTARELVPDLDASWFRLYGTVAKTGQGTRFENHAPAMGRWFDVYASRVPPAEEKQVALVFKDITARKQIETERERLLVAETLARREAEDASRLRDEFLATVSHELRTPLNSMLGWVQMLRAGHLSPPMRDRALETIERNARAQTQLIEDLLDSSSILAGKLRLVLAPVDARAAVEAALETVHPTAEAKGVRLVCDLDSASVLADAHRLQQIVWNLLVNAVKFTPKGGTVGAHLSAAEDVVTIRVTDTGVGISKDFLPHVFERFRQGDGSTTRAHGGLGLGLAIVRQLVEMHGGTVSVRSGGEGRGAEFVVELPRRADVTTTADAPDSSPARSPELPRLPALEGARVLVVDDEADVRDMLRALLERSGVDVRFAVTAEEGLEAFRREVPDLLVSDIGMPDEDGYSLLRKVRALPRGEGGEVPAVALTAYARASDRTRALQAGFDLHIAKPVEPLELLVAMSALLTRARDRA